MDLALNNQEWLVWHKTKQNQIHTPRPISSRTAAFVNYILSVLF